MPFVTREMSLQMQKGRWRPHCHVCGHFIGEGGYYDVMDNEEGYSTCKKHTQQAAFDEFVNADERLLFR